MTASNCDPAVDAEIRSWYGLVDLDCLAVHLQAAFPALAAEDPGPLRIYIAWRAAVLGVAQ